MNKTKKQVNIVISGIFVLVFFLSFNLALASEIRVGNVIQLVNESRTKQGISVLEENKILDQIAQDKLNDMIKNDYFAHTSPQGVNPWEWFSKNKYDYKYAGENLAIGFSEVEDQHKAWMESETHRKNILNDKFQEIGVAVGAGEIHGQLSIIVVQEFGTLANAPLKSSKKNQSFEYKKDIIKSEEKIGAMPMVLSSKEVAKKNPSKIEKNSWSNEFYEKVGGYEYGIDGYDLTYGAIFLLMVFLLSLVPGFVVAESGRNIFDFLRLRTKHV